MSDFFNPMPPDEQLQAENPEAFQQQQPNTLQNIAATLQQDEPHRQQAQRSFTDSMVRSVIEPPDQYVARRIKEDLFGGQEPTKKGKAALFLTNILNAVAAGPKFKPLQQKVREQALQEYKLEQTNRAADVSENKALWAGQIAQQKAAEAAQYQRENLELKRSTAYVAAQLKVRDLEIKSNELVRKREADYQKALTDGNKAEIAERKQALEEAKYNHNIEWGPNSTYREAVLSEIAANPTKDEGKIREEVYTRLRQAGRLGQEPRMNVSPQPEQQIGIDANNNPVYRQPWLKTTLSGPASKVQNYLQEQNPFGQPLPVPNQAPSQPGVNIPQFAPGQPNKPQLAFQNNNPGNLRFAGQEGATAGASGFARFDTPQAGFEALEKQIKLDASRGMTVEQYINKFAPPSENDTNSYVQQVTSALGIDPKSPLSQVDPNRLAQAQAKIESSTEVTNLASVAPRSSNYQALSTYSRPFFKNTADRDASMQRKEVMARATALADLALHLRDKKLVDPGGGMTGWAKGLLSDASESAALKLVDRLANSADPKENQKASYLISLWEALDMGRSLQTYSLTGKQLNTTEFQAGKSRWPDLGLYFTNPERFITRSLEKAMLFKMFDYKNNLAAQGMDTSFLASYDLTRKIVDHVNEKYALYQKGKISADDLANQLDAEKVFGQDLKNAYTKFRGGAPAPPIVTGESKKKSDKELADEFLQRYSK